MESENKVKGDRPHLQITAFGQIYSTIISFHGETTIHSGGGLCLVKCSNQKVGILVLLVDLAIDRRKPTAVLELGGDLVAMEQEITGQKGVQYTVH